MVLYDDFRLSLSIRETEARSKLECMFANGAKRARVRARFLLMLKTLALHGGAAGEVAAVELRHTKRSRGSRGGETRICPGDVSTLAGGRRWQYPRGAGEVVGCTSSLTCPSTAEFCEMVCGRAAPSTPARGEETTALAGKLSVLLHSYLLAFRR